MSRWVRRVLAVLVAVALPATAPATATVAAAQQGQPITLAPQPVSVPAQPIDLPVDSLDSTVAVHSNRVVLQADILFAFNSSNLTGAAPSRIGQAAAEIRRRHPTALRIQGYTDSIGNPAYNVGLSQRRATAVEHALQQQLGASAPPMQAIGYGEADPVASNTKPDGSDDPAGRALNRRVEIHYV